MLIDILKAITLGIVEGLTEFLPISSTGHLILVNQWLTFSEPFTKLFDVVIQLGAILAVVIYFRKRLWPFTNNATPCKETQSLWLKTMLGVIPALGLGALFNDVIEQKLFNPWTVAIALIIGGIILIYIERRKPTTAITSLQDLSYKTAWSIGLIQCLALIPGTSRSAATIIGAMLLGASRTVATEFSFFLAIPTLLAASAYSLLKHGGGLTSTEFIILLIGFLVSFVMAWLVVKFFMHYIKQHTLIPFGYYRIVLGILILITKQ